jgi:hypothetical protein
VLPDISCIYNNKNILKTKQETTIVLLPLLVRRHIEFCGRFKESLVIRCYDGSEIALTETKGPIPDLY